MRVPILDIAELDEMYREHGRCLSPEAAVEGFEETIACVSSSVELIHKYIWS
jgi:hypothetical protein